MSHTGPPGHNLTQTQTTLADADADAAGGDREREAEDEDANDFGLETASRGHGVPREVSDYRSASGNYHVKRMVTTLYNVGVVRDRHFTAKRTTDESGRVDWELIDQTMIERPLPSPSEDDDESEDAGADADQDQEAL